MIKQSCCLFPDASANLPTFTSDSKASATSPPRFWRPLALKPRRTRTLVFCVFCTLSETRVGGNRILNPSVERGRGNKALGSQESAELLMECFRRSTAYFFSFDMLFLCSTQPILGYLPIVFHHVCRSQISIDCSMADVDP